MKPGSKRDTKGVEEARRSLPAILEAAARGKTTIITRHGNAIAAVVPVSVAKAAAPASLLSLAGSGKGLWGRDSTKDLDRLRGEWSR
jgi:antitoxin (DNA-binding transcriptional repressor) of toxin-antitoxin stability system